MRQCGVLAGPGAGAGVQHGDVAGLVPQVNALLQRRQRRVDAHVGPGEGWEGRRPRLPGLPEVTRGYQGYLRLPVVTTGSTFTFFVSGWFYIDTYTVY